MKANQPTHTSHPLHATSTKAAATPIHKTESQLASRERRGKPAESQGTKKNIRMSPTSSVHTHTVMSSTTRDGDPITPTRKTWVPYTTRVC